MSNVLHNLQFDAMGGFLDFQRGWWDTETRQETIDRFYRVFRRLQAKGFRRVNYFAWLNDGSWHNAHYDHHAPFRALRSPESRLYWQT